ncbi:hypothetical protein PG988_007772 [Apiospora saccharicola]
MASLRAKVNESPRPLLDHIVILVPHAFLASPPSWFAEAFTLYPGGKHADGFTENVLVFLADGSYLELIAFVDDDVGRGGRAGHRWGGQKEGTVIDWALTLLSENASDAAGSPESVSAAFKEIQRKVQEVGGGIEYRDLVRGGRNRPDGEVLEWATSAADAAGKPLEPGVLAFWCLDETPRKLRVPYKGGKLAEHASGAVGVALLQVTPPAAATSKSGDDKSGLRSVYDVLFTKSDDGDQESSWTVGTPEEGQHKPGEVHLRDPKSESCEQEQPGKLTIEFFTKSSEFAGKKIGGHITDQTQLEFEFVSSN